MSTANLAISVIVNTTDRAQALDTLLRSLYHQSYRNFEVIVVVGPTRDHTLDVLMGYAGRVRVERCPAPNLSVSRNIGLAAAAGEIVAFLDDDAVPCRTWLAQLAARFADPALDATGGSVFLVHPNRPMIQTRLALTSALAEQIDARNNVLADLPPAGDGRFWTARMMGANMAYRKSVLLDIGGFDEFYEWVFDDTDIAVRLALSGKSIDPMDDAWVYHVPASSRNRVAYTPLGRWWVQTKAAAYFAIKNGRSTGESEHAIVLRILHLFHGHWKWLGEMQRAGQLTFRQMAVMRGRELVAATQGTLAGLARPRRLLAAALSPEDRGATRDTDFVPFLPDKIGLCGAVDPITGRQPVVTMPEPPLRVCLLSGAYPPTAYEGVGRHTNLMARGLFELGHIVHVIARGESEQVVFYDGAYVHRIPTSLTRYGRYQRLPHLYHTLNRAHVVHERVRQLVRNDGIQLVDSPVWQVEGIVTERSGLLPVVVRPQTATRQVMHFQRENDEGMRLIGELEVELVAGAAYLAPNSLATLQALREVYGLPASARFQVVPHGIEPVPDECVRPFDVAAPPATLTVLYVGRLEQRKGILDLFGAIPAVLAHVPDARFVIAGADNSLSDGFQARHGMDYPTYFAKHYAAVMSAVTFLGAVSEEMLNTLYQTCDLFVAPSLYESFGLIYLEAMNYAKPVIGCQAGGIPEVVEEGVTGRLVEPAASLALAETIVELLSSPAQLREMGLAGRRRLLDHFTYVQMARGFEAIYRAVLGSASGGN